MFILAPAATVLARNPTDFNNYARKFLLSSQLELLFSYGDERTHFRSAERNNYINDEELQNSTTQPGFLIESDSHNRFRFTLILNEDRTEILDLIAHVPKIHCPFFCKSEVMKKRLSDIDFAYRDGSFLIINFWHLRQILAVPWDNSLEGGSMEWERTNKT